MVTKDFCITISAMFLRNNDVSLKVWLSVQLHVLDILGSGHFRLFFGKNLNRSWNFPEAFSYLRESVVFQSQTANQIWTNPISKHDITHARRDWHWWGFRDWLRAAINRDKAKNLFWKISVEDNETKQRRLLSFFVIRLLSLCRFLRVCSSIKDLGIFGTNVWAFQKGPHLSCNDI